MSSGKCAMRGTCGSVGWGGQLLPCPYDGPAEMPDSANFRETLVATCGSSYTDVPVCCTLEQVGTLSANFQQVEPLIGSCPACRNNFRDFFCAFTCSHRQGTFLNVSSTQLSNTNQQAVKSVEFFVGNGMGQGFYDSCKEVKFSATNGYAMDFIGGGAKTYPEFLKYMGDVRPGLGSPFQIDFPNRTFGGYSEYNPRPRSCADENLSNHCSCTDCPSICPVLPTIPPPGSHPSCHIGPLPCLSFLLLLTYAIGLIGFVGGYGFGRAVRLARSHETPSGLIGASSLATRHDDTVSDSRHSLGRGASLLDQEGLQPRQYYLNTILRRFFYRLGWLCANNPTLIFILSLLFVTVANVGWKFFKVENDPVRLWVAPNSDSRAQKDIFDKHFGPLYRVEQLFITTAALPILEHRSPVAPVASNIPLLQKRPVLSFKSLQWLFDVEDEIRSLRSPKSNLAFQDVCFKPAGPGGICVVQSVTAWLGGSLDKDDWSDKIRTCARQPASCMPEYGQPLQPEYVLGAVPARNGSSQWLDAESLIVTYVVADSLNTTVKAKAEEWEEELLSYLLSLSRTASRDFGLEISFSTGISLEGELNRSTNTDIRVAVLSYLAMFLYVSLTLGRGEGGDHKSGTFFIKKWCFPGRGTSGANATSIASSRGGYSFLRHVFVESKVALGLFGLILVLLSIACSIGIWSYFGVKVTLIIAEVIPFLVLAVGVDNVFLLVAELERQNSLHGLNASSHSPSATTATPLSPSQRYANEQDSDDLDSGSIYLAVEERVARCVAKVGPSIFISSGTQTLTFALGALVPMPAVRNFALYAALSVFLNAVMQVTLFVSSLALDLRRTENGRVDCFPCVKIPARITLPDHSKGPGGALVRFFRRTYAPFILHPTVKGIVIAIFSGLAIFSTISLQNIELGLDQKLALPSDSYLLDYFKAVESYLDVGPPVYFVAESLNASTRSAQRSICGKFTTCDEFSVANTLEAERKRPESSFISQPPAIWIDDFLKWLDPSLDSCCRVRKSDPSVFCTSREPEKLCQPCLAGKLPPWNVTMDGMPEGWEFYKYLAHWLDSPTDECGLGGEQSYGAAISVDERGTVIASHFRTYHTSLRNQGDYINAFVAARRIAGDLSAETGSKVFPYSIFYVFFEQYLYIISITQEILGLGLASVLLLTSVLLGSWRTGTIVTGVVGLTILDVMGVMGVWGISLNAISLVNLEISLGIAVEFCSHIARGYMSTTTEMDDAERKERDERVFTSLVEVGPSVLSGITFTKLIGISVLAFTRSKLLETYFFRMWLSLILLGAVHGLVLLPVLLSFAGGPGYALEDADEEWMSNAVRRPDYEYTPFSADDESTLSDL
ncbi:uncharacterized protein EI90DRAFT_3143703 [Cantharellus anzutake]|uniref:uncharacterized protein n=1 Tax=Cantharellus anzutake TaxID=1750568 RepID=UPI001905F8F1|nr:uncharacterized protein EI90DRAFT_3143703 [Cantharellus anzutake]KAF8341334.1 hypothetical protein EI90DRAFT_3143703 [Cantharellus anzutake]